MNISVEIERDSGVAVVSCSGELRLDDARRAAEALWSTPGWRGESGVWDLRAAQFDLSSSDVREMASFVLANQREEPPAKMTFVVARDVDFGMSRMFQAFRDDPPTAFRVFRDYEEAIRWARSPAQTDKPE